MGIKFRSAQEKQPKTIKNTSDIVIIKFFIFSGPMLLLSFNPPPADDGLILHPFGAVSGGTALISGKRA